jgi:hypothetical protein
MSARLDPSGLVFDHAINMNTGRMAFDRAPPAPAREDKRLAVDIALDDEAILAELIPHLNRL